MSPQQQFKVGDVVYLIEYDRMRQAKIERVTKTQAILENGDRYRQVDGFLVGSDSWSNRGIKHPTPVLDIRWDTQRMVNIRAALSRAAARGTESEIRAAFESWEKLEKEVNGE